jgi:hypothetical protein
MTLVHVVRALVIGGVFHAYRLLNLTLVEELGLEAFRIFPKNEAEQDECCYKEKLSFHYFGTRKNEPLSL